MDPRPERFVIRAIDVDDNAAVAALIRAVMPEFGAAGPGFAIHDPEVDDMAAAYAKPGHAYFVLEADGVIVGGGGVGALVGGGVVEADRVCELRKMYFRPEARGHGQGERLLRHCLETAQTLGYRRCYLETLASMTAAQHLYRKLGFTPLPQPLGATGHFGCDRWYVTTLRD